jgi:hypothetical protein
MLLAFASTVVSGPFETHDHIYFFLTYTYFEIGPPFQRAVVISTPLLGSDSAGAYSLTYPLDFNVWIHQTKGGLRPIISS